MKAEEYHWGRGKGATPSLTSRDGNCGSAAADASLESLQLQAQRHSREIEASQRRTLQLADNAAQVGAATLAELHAQGEQLRQVRRGQQEIEANLKTSDGLLKGMESWGGYLRDAVGSWWAGGSEDEPVRTSSAPPSVPDRPGVALPSGTSAGGAAVARESVQAGEESAVDALSRVVTSLNAQATQMNATLREQSSTLDEAVRARARAPPPPPPACSPPSVRAARASAPGCPRHIGTAMKRCYRATPCHPAARGRGQGPRAVAA